ncbi:MAG: HAMP domain-containing histidine kinase, partial [Bdellovibrionales bacterium]|nr:HAMP domain-containing histidine kinase [Bdellovibrionales bacterium]
YTYKVKSGKTIRILNLNLPNFPDRTLQIGSVIDTTLVDWKFISHKLFVYLVVTIITILIFSLLLTNFLLSPLKLLGEHLQVATQDLQNLKPVPGIPKKLIKYTDKSFINNDVFSVLVKNTSDLLERININYKMTKPWTYQLAHEIKTPLSILNFDVESLKAENFKDQSITQSMNEQIQRISSTVSQFLEWASVENTQAKDNLFAIKIVNVIDEIISGIGRIHPERISYLKTEDFVVISNPQHLQQLITNLLTNALNYSPEDSKVIVETFENSFKITDQGPGIPVDVLGRIGQPFNSGPPNATLKHKRTGLGLAWINTLTKLYRWELNIDSKSTGTTITIKFTKDLIT